MGIAVYKRRVDPFREDEIELLQAFVAQPANGLTNAQHLRDLEASLAMQRATSEILRLISSNPGEQRVVLDAILAKAAELVGAQAGSISLRVSEGVGLFVASHGPAMEPYVGTTLDSGALPLARVTITDSVVHTDDLAAAGKGIPYFEELVEVARVGSYAAAFMAVDGERLGLLHMYRHEVDPFDQAELDTLAAFAEQASLAISNAKLFTDLEESLARQQAMTEVLDAVSTARADLQPVFDALADQANRLCGGTGAGIALREGDVLVGTAGTGALAAGHQDRAEGAAVPITADPLAFARGNRTWPIDDQNMLGAAALHHEVIHVRDWDEEDPERMPAAASRLAGRRSALAIPMIRDGT